MFSDIFKGHRDVTLAYLLHDGVPYHIETSLLICSANQQTSFYDRDFLHEKSEMG